MAERAAMRYPPPVNSQQTEATDFTPSQVGRRFCVRPTKCLLVVVRWQGEAVALPVFWASRGS